MSCGCRQTCEVRALLAPRPKDAGDGWVRYYLGPRAQAAVESGEAEWVGVALVATDNASPGGVLVVAGPDAPYALPLEAPSSSLLPESLWAPLTEPSATVAPMSIGTVPDVWRWGCAAPPGRPVYVIGGARPTSEYPRVAALLRLRQPTPAAC